MTPWEVAEQLDDEADTLVQLFSAFPPPEQGLTQHQVGEAIRQLRSAAHAVRLEGRVSRVEAGCCL